MRQAIHISSLLRIVCEAEKALGDRDVIVKADLDALRDQLVRYASEPHPSYNLLVTDEF